MNITASLLPGGSDRFKYWVPIGSYRLELIPRGKRIAMELRRGANRRWRVTLKNSQAYLLLDGLSKVLQQGVRP
jgi:hypothetical protein